MEVTTSYQKASNLSNSFLKSDIHIQCLRNIQGIMLCFRLILYRFGYKLLSLISMIMVFS